jgi:hypothetical protein
MEAMSNPWFNDEQWAHMAGDAKKPADSQLNSSSSGSVSGEERLGPSIVIHRKMVEGLTPKGKEALMGILDAMMALFSKQQQGLPLEIADLAYPKTLIGEGLGSCSEKVYMGEPPKQVVPPDSKVIWTTDK